MNLTGDPWVPVAFASGERRLVSLRDAFLRGEEIFDFVATPPQRIALTRLLVCIAQAALDGPKDEEDWRTCRDRIPTAALAYLEQQRACFDLYGELGFLQVPNLEEKPKPPVDKLDCGTAINAGMLFDHSSVPEGRLRSAEWSALMLLTFQSFSPSGLVGVTRWNQVWTSKDRKEKDQDGSDSAPCLEGSPLHVVLKGKNLISTIHLNLLTKRVVGALPNVVWGRPVWEQMPGSAGDMVVNEIRKSYLGRLVPLPRAIKLQKGSRRMTLANAITYPKIGQSREPSAIVVMRKKGGKQEVRYLRIDPAKHPWRDLSSILALGDSPESGGALVLAHLRALGRNDSFDVWAGGLGMDPRPGKAAKFLDSAEWAFHLAGALLGSTALQKYQRGVDLANLASGRLREAIVTYFEDLAVGEFKRNKAKKFVRNDQRSRDQRNGVIAAAASQFWRSLDGRYIVLVDAAKDPTRGLAEEWYGIVRDAMERAFERACARQGARKLRAYAKGSQRLRLRKPGRRDANLAA